MQTKDFTNKGTSLLNDSFNAGNRKKKRNPEKRREEKRNIQSVRHKAPKRIKGI